MGTTSGRSILDDPTLLSELIGLVYDAAGAPDLWPVFLERLSRTLELSAATFVLTHRSDAGLTASIPMSFGMGSEMFQAYDEHIAAINPFRSMVMQLQSGAVVPTDELMPDGDFVRTEFFNDYYALTGNRHGFTTVIHREGEQASMILAHRAADQPRSSDAELALMRMLTPHLQRARLLAGRLGTLASNERIVDSVLDRLLVGLVFVDASGQVVSANAKAEEILQEQDGLGLSQGRLVTGRVRDTHALDAIVTAACATAQRRGHVAPLSLRLDRPSGRRALEVMACPIDRESEVWSDGLAAAFLVVNDGESDLRGAAARLRDLYGLTDAEARLAVALANGATVKEWAAQRGVSVETVRWQLKQVFAKTGVSRQSDLLRLVLLGPGLVG